MQETLRKAIVQARRCTWVTDLIKINQGLRGVGRSPACAIERERSHRASNRT